MRHLVDIKSSKVNETHREVALKCVVCCLFLSEKESGRERIIRVEKSQEANKAKGG